MALDFRFEEKGIFRCELKNRFKSKVTINGKDCDCYIQSSPKLSNYLKIEGKEVYLTKNNEGHFSNYTVYAVKHKKDKIILCPFIANKIVYSEINRKMFSYLGNRLDAILEHSVNQYKADIYLPQTKTIIEIKALISDCENGNIFPTVFSSRTISQLKKIMNLLSAGYKCILIIVSFNPYYDSIIINKNTEFYSLLNKCLENGLMLKSYSVTCLNDIIKIKKELTVFSK